jgi:quercetin dioxygenase-like cupin family protein
MISGDLHVGEEVLRAGDFHHAEAGSQHAVNWSEQGCVLICVLSKEDLMNQLG